MSKNFREQIRLNPYPNLFGTKRLSSSSSSRLAWMWNLASDVRPKNIIRWCRIETLITIEWTKIPNKPCTATYSWIIMQFNIYIYTYHNKDSINQEETVRSVQAQFYVTSLRILRSPRHLRVHLDISRGIYF
jgi:hypothetical protein